MTQDTLRILYIAYSLLPLSDASCGGAEQALLLVESQMRLRGHATTVAACDGSRLAADTFLTGIPPTEPDAFAKWDAVHTDRIVVFVRKQQQSRPFDLIHDHGGSFWKHAAQVDAPVLATLHLPRSFYPEQAFASMPLNLEIGCVSQSQARSFCDVPQLAGVVRNGIDVDRFPFSDRKSDYLLWLGRICPEKGPHLALDAAGLAGMPIVLAGEVYPFSYHQNYFQQEIVPRLQGMQGRAKLVSGISLERKLELIRDARAVLIPSLVDETSSLVAMEAMACGTPVVCFRRGALPEVVAHETTGFLVESLDEMVEAISEVAGIDPHACRERVELHFSAARVGDEYEQLYRGVIAPREALASAM